MNFSHPDHAFAQGSASPEKASPSFSVKRQYDLPDAPLVVQAGSMNDANMVRSVITDAMGNCGKSRVQIAEEMTVLSGSTVTERMLNNFSATSKENRFPAELDRAFCAATGDTRLLTCRAEAFGLHVIGGVEWQLLELGRQTLKLKRAQAAASAAEVRLEGIVL